LRRRHHARRDASRSGEAWRGGKVKSATFFTAQVDFEQAGDLRHFIDDQQIETIARLAPKGYVDGRYLAATSTCYGRMTSSGAM
jgi:polyhydroxyalkanoate synthase